MKSEYKFRQCPSDENVQCNMSEDSCGGCPTAESAARAKKPTNAEYIKNLDDKGIVALLNVVAGRDMDIIREQCSWCKYGDINECLDMTKHGAGDTVSECDKATWRWLHYEAGALVKAVEEERRKILK